MNELERLQNTLSNGHVDNDTTGEKKEDVPGSEVRPMMKST